MNPDRHAQIRAPEYWKHARPFLKRRFWKAVRRSIRNRLIRGIE